MSILNYKRLLIVSVVFFILAIGCTTSPDYEKRKIRGMENHKRESEEWRKNGIEEMAEYHEDECNRTARQKDTIFGAIFEGIFNDRNADDPRCKQRDN